MNINSIKQQIQQKQYLQSFLNLEIAIPTSKIKEYA